MLEWVGFARARRMHLRRARSRRTLCGRPLARNTDVRGWEICSACDRTREHLGLGALPAEPPEAVRA